MKFVRCEASVAVFVQLFEKRSRFGRELVEINAAVVKKIDQR